jgi:hypothetical protein
MLPFYILHEAFLPSKKALAKWYKGETTACNWNNKGLNGIFMAVSPKEFRHISNCKIAKEAWDILAVTHEGTKGVKTSKLYMLTSRFEEIKIKEDKTFYEFYAQLNDIINPNFNLGEKIVRKILMSLLERFRPKVTTIKESKDVDAMKVEDLVGSFQTYELSLTQPKKKNLALRSSHKEKVVVKLYDEESDS